MTTAAARIEAFAFSDLPGIYRVCAEVDAHGGPDRQWLHAPDLAGHVYAGPYLSSDPALGWVVADELGVGGYILATANALEFEAWREAHWYPSLRRRHPLRPASSDGSADDRYLRAMHALPRAPETVPAGYSAELHIKLDPRMTGRGWGRRLVEALVGELRARGLPGVHLAVAAENANGIAFYAHVGFRPHTQGTDTLVMVKDVT